MKKDVTLEQWSKALKSGRYKQNRNSLSNTHENSRSVKYCCLGVLAKELGNNVKLREYPSDSQYCKVFKCNKRYTNDISTRFIILNDSNKLNFKEIAYVIDNKLYLKENSNKIALNRNKICQHLF
jgi:hypothetical protein